MGKRLFDIACAATALLLLCPVLLAVALWVRLDSPGPVIFRQQRVGRGGRLFSIFKFRTMRVGAETVGLPLTVGDDTRITRAGAWLRRSKVDELPQLVNVLWGDMSLVGPRPEVPRYVALYPADLRETVLSVRPRDHLPGLSGLPQRKRAAGAQRRPRAHLCRRNTTRQAALCQPVCAHTHPVAGPENPGANRLDSAGRREPPPAAFP